MAERRFYATKDFKHPRYSTRMLKAGDPVDLDAPTARLYSALGAITDQKPVRAGATPQARPVETEASAKAPKAEAPKAKPKRTRKRKAKK